MMMKRTQQRILFHGLIVLLVGMLCGVPFALAEIYDWGDEAVRVWLLGHLELIVIGIWMMVVAAVSPVLVLTSRKIAILLYAVMASGYGECIALPIAAIGGVRGLEPKAPILNLIVFCSNTIAALASVVVLVVMLNGIVAALRETDAN